MSIDVNKYNYELLSKLKGGESVGIEQGKLVIIQKTSQVAQAILQTDVRVTKIAENFVKQRIKEASWNEAISTIDTFVKSNLLDKDQITSLTLESYEKKYEQLLAGIEEPDDFDKLAAEAMVTSEMAYDQHIPESLREKIKPELTPIGTSGTYILKNRQGEKIGIFKPQMQEYGMPLNPRGKADKYDEMHPKKNSFFEGHIQGSGWQNEIAASIIDGTIGIPETMEISLLFPANNQLVQQKGAFQRYINSTAVSLTKVKPDVVEKFDEDLAPFEVQKVALFDILTSNCDRNMNNILYKDGHFIPIDHGLAFRHQPDARGIWTIFPQLKEDIDDDLKKWFFSIEIEDVCKQLSELGLDDAVILNLRNRHAFLDKQIKLGKNLYEIAQLCKFK